MNKSMDNHRVYVNINRWWNTSTLQFANLSITDMEDLLQTLA